jgi:hypothetical protein
MRKIAESHATADAYLLRVAMGGSRASERDDYIGFLGRRFQSRNDALALGDATKRPREFCTPSGPRVFLE